MRGRGPGAYAGGYCLKVGLGADEASRGVAIKALIERQEASLLIEDGAGGFQVSYN